MNRCIFSNTRKQGKISEINAVRNILRTAKTKKKPRPSRSLPICTTNAPRCSQAEAVLLIFPPIARCKYSQLKRIISKQLCYDWTFSFSEASNRESHKTQFPNDIFMDDGIFQSAKIILLWILNQFLPSLKENRSTEGWNGGLQKDVSMVLLPQHSQLESHCRCDYGKDLK